MSIAGPVTVTTAAPFAAAAENFKLGYTLGDCTTDTLTVSNPGGHVPPIICGYNTGQHIYVPASDSCNMINIDIDTGSSITRSWQIKVTQYECNSPKAPEQECLQWHTADTGTIASFNWDTTATTIAASQTHLSSQYYDICIRRKKGFCQICYTPQILGTGTTVASSYGIGGSSDAPAQKASWGALCTGLTANSNIETAQSTGDYLTIYNMQDSSPVIATVATAIGNGEGKICGNFWNVAAAAAATAQGTVCTYTTPFKVGVFFDADEATFDPVGADDFKTVDSNAIGTAGSGRGMSGFWLSYWQVAC